MNTFNHPFTSDEELELASAQNNLNNLQDIVDPYWNNNQLNDGIEDVVHNPNAFQNNQLQSGTSNWVQNPNQEPELGQNNLNTGIGMLNGFQGFGGSNWNNNQNVVQNPNMFQNNQLPQDGILNYAQNQFPYAYQNNVNQPQAQAHRIGNLLGCVGLFVQEIVNIRNSSTVGSPSGADQTRDFTEAVMKACMDFTYGPSSPSISAPITSASPSTSAPVALSSAAIGCTAATILAPSTSPPFTVLPTALSSTSTAAGLGPVSADAAAGSGSPSGVLAAIPEDGPSDGPPLKRSRLDLNTSPNGSA